jgi:hypothetical protein
MLTTDHQQHDAAPRPTDHDADDFSDNFTAWMWADDGDADGIGELHRRFLRDRARRALERDAAALARGRALQRSTLTWTAQSLPTDHPRRRAVLALALRTRTPIEPMPARLQAELRRAAFEAVCAVLRDLAAADTPAVFRTAAHCADEARRPPVTSATRRMPRAPTRVRLA